MSEIHSFRILLLSLICASLVYNFVIFHTSNDRNIISQLFYLMLLNSSIISICFILLLQQGKEYSLVYNIILISMILYKVLVKLFSFYRKFSFPIHKAFIYELTCSIVVSIIITALLIVDFSITAFTDTYMMMCNVMPINIIILFILLVILELVRYFGKQLTYDTKIGGNLILIYGILFLIIERFV